jgi:hypothetical protein
MMAHPRHAKAAECFAFTWRRRVKGPGFRWEPDAAGRMLLVGLPQDSLDPYEPLVEETGLFLTFAHLSATPKAFLRFADRYGRLGTYHSFGPEKSEPLYEWQLHHRWMRFLTHLRSASLNQEPILHRHVKWEGDEVVFHFPKIGTGDREDWRHRGRRRERLQNTKGEPLFKRGDLAGPGMWFCAFAIEDWLAELKELDKPISPHMIWSERERRPQLVFGPSSLLGAMVYQLAAALHGGWPFQECANCHKFFRLQPGVNRANRLTCSQTCKQYIHNRRVQRAQELSAAGWTVPQIIRELNVKPNRSKSSSALVRAWIERK